MSEKETLGMTEQTSEKKELSAAEKAKKKKAKYTLAKVIVILCVVLCVVLTVFELGVTYRTIKAVEVDGTEYSVAEYNWLYTNNVYEVYNNYYRTYGEYAQYFFNPNGNLSEQVYNQETGETWADYMKDYTEQAVVEMTKLYDNGQEAGFELSEDIKADCETEWDALESTAKAYGYSANDYAELNYGRGVNEKVFKEMYIRYCYAMEYAQHVSENFEISGEDIDAYYGENKEAFDTVSYKSYFVSGAPSEGTDEETAMDEAEARAQGILSGTEEVEFNENKYALYGNTNALFADWVFDSARAEGDKEVFESETGYYVVEFVGKNDLHYNTVNVRHILVSPKDESEASLEAALAEANGYLDEFKANGSTEEAFAELAKEHSVDGSAVNGGLYENVFKGQMVAEFEDWCFDPARKVGDCEVIKTDYGYHVMYFSGVAEEYYSLIVDQAIRNDRLNGYLDSIIEGIEVSELFGNKYVGKHFA